MVELFLGASVVGIAYMAGSFSLPSVARMERDRMDYWTKDLITTRDFYVAKELRKDA